MNLSCSLPCDFTKLLPLFEERKVTRSAWLFTGKSDSLRLSTNSQSVQSGMASSSRSAESSMVRREAPPQMVEYRFETNLKLGRIEASLATSLCMYSCLESTWTRM